jgi:hypothetical protein
MQYFVVKSHVNIFMEIVHKSSENTWAYFHSPRISKLNTVMYQVKKLHGENTLLFMTR